MTDYITYPNITSIDLSTPLSSIIIYGNSVLGGVFAPLFLSCVFITTMLVLRNYPYKEKSMVASFFLTFIVSILLFASTPNVVPAYYPIGLLILLSVSAYASSRWHSD